METYKILDREYPVTGYVSVQQTGTVPLADLPMMSDYQWQALSLKDRLENPEKYRTILGEDVEATIARLRECLEGVLV